MTFSFKHSAITAALLACGVITLGPGRALAQDSAMAMGEREGEVTVIGCLQTAGKHNTRFVLANVTTNVVTSVPDPKCTATSAETVELEGVSGTKLHLDASVGNWVEISGKLEGSPNDRELRVKSFRPVPVVITRTIERTAPPVAMAEPAPAPVSAAPAPQYTPEAPVATSGTTPAALPHTASTLPLIAVLGVLSLAAGFGVRFSHARSHR